MDELRYPLLALARLRMGTDGEGITTLVAGAGCPLHCRWCINERLLREAAAEQIRNRGGIFHTGMVKKADYLRFAGGFCLHICVKKAILLMEGCLRSNLPHGAADEFIVDCKDMNPEIYRRYTGGDQSLMVSNLRHLLHLIGSERIVVRVPLIPDYNAAEDQANSVSSLKALGITRFDLFPYIIRK